MKRYFSLTEAKSDVRDATGPFSVLIQVSWNLNQPYSLMDGKWAALPVRVTL